MGNVPPGVLGQNRRRRTLKKKRLLFTTQPRLSSVHSEEDLGCSVSPVLFGPLDMCFIPLHFSPRQPFSGKRTGGQPFTIQIEVSIEM